jgi:glycine/serine hydroxymethyltransferase
MKIRFNTYFYSNNVHKNNTLLIASFDNCKILIETLMPKLILIFIGLSVYSSHILENRSQEVIKKCNSTVLDAIGKL